MTFASVDSVTIRDIERGLERAQHTHDQALGALVAAANKLKQARFQDGFHREDALRQHIAHERHPEIATLQAKHDEALAAYQDAERALRNQIDLLDEYITEAADRASQPTRTNATSEGAPQ